MVFTCCVPGCNTGYRSNKSKEKVSLFIFPKDEDMRQKWIRAIPRNLLFNYTHNFKNIYNNFIGRGRMNILTGGFESILGNSCIAHFAHIRRLYGLEEDKVLKIAYGLKKVSLNPSSLARTSPQHA